MEKVKSKNIELDKYYDALKSENYDESFNKVESWLRREQFFHGGKAQRTKSEKLKSFLFVHKAKFAYIVLIFFVTLIVANVKVTSKETVAGVITWKVDKRNKDAIEKIDKSNWLDKNQLVVNEQKENDVNLINYKFIVPDNSTLNLEQLKSKLEEINDINSIQIVPITEAVNVPLYAAAMHTIFNSNIPPKFVNVYDVKQNVFEQLKVAGINDEDCDVDYEPETYGVKVTIRLQQDSLRYKIHDDIMRGINTEKVLRNTERMLENMREQLNENLPRIRVEFGDYGRFNAEKLDETLKKVQITIDSIQIKFDNEDFEENMERSLNSLDTLDDYINNQVEESLRKSEEHLRRNEEFLRQNEEYLRRNEENLKSLDTLGEFINKQVEVNIQKNLKHLKILDTLGPFIQKQIRIHISDNFDTSKFNQNMKKFKIKMDSLEIRFNNNEYDNDNDNEDGIIEENESKDKINEDLYKGKLNNELKLRKL
jgi:hypothetical protein